MMPRTVAVSRGRKSVTASGKARATSQMGTRILSGPLGKRPRVPSAFIRPCRGCTNGNTPKAMSWWRVRRWPIHCRGLVMTFCETWCPLRSRKPLAEVQPPVGLELETGRKNGSPPCRLMRPDLDPYQRACHRMVESSDASAVSHMETGPTREPCLCEQYTIGRGRELTVCWVTTGARGRGLACGRDLTEP